MYEIDNDTGEVITPFVRTPYNYNAKKVSTKTGLECKDPTKAQQQFKDEVNINTIVHNFGVTGERPPVMQYPEPQEFIEATDFQTSMNVVVKARESFQTLTSKQRARFNNDPQRFMEFIHNAENQDEAIKLGLATDNRPKNPPEPQGGEQDTK
jgi:phage internal scaffolding protein